MRKVYKPGKKPPKTKQSLITAYFPILFPKKDQDPKNPQDPAD
jgi:hypothetical protein